MVRFLTVTASLVALTLAASAAPAVQRLRGTVESINGNALTIQTNDGKSLSVDLGADAKVAFVVPSTLDAVKDGVFIGTATKGDNPPTALEVLVFPEAMRGTGEGHYDWDEITDTTASGDNKSMMMMTAGTVKAGAKHVVKSAMTNGTIKTGTAASGGKKLTVTYGDGKSIDITVPPSAPIVTVEPADRAALTAGAKVFVVAAEDGGKYSGKRILVGKNGLTPPM